MSFLRTFIFSFFCIAGSLTASISDIRLEPCNPSLHGEKIISLCQSFAHKKAESSPQNTDETIINKVIAPSRACIYQDKAILVEAERQNPYYFCETAREAVIKSINEKPLAKTLTIVKEPDTVIGYIFYKNTENNTRYIEMWQIDESLRGKGYGTTALQQFEKLSLEEGITRIELESKFGAYRFYEKNGYKSSDETSNTNEDRHFFKEL